MIKNLMVPGIEGGVTIHYPSGDQTAIFDAVVRYEKEKTPLIVIAGQISSPHRSQILKDL